MELVYRDMLESFLLGFIHYIYCRGAEDILKQQNFFKIFLTSISPPDNEMVQRLLQNKTKR